MFYITVRPEDWNSYLRSDVIYFGPVVEAYSSEAEMAIDPATGEVVYRGLAERKESFAVLPAMYPTWILRGIWNYLTGKLVSIFGVKPEDNPLRMEFHLGYRLGERPGRPGVRVPPTPARESILPGIRLNDIIDKGFSKGRYKKLAEVYV